MNLFNAALVTPTYYVYFTSTTIISSIVLFRGFKGTPIQIITIVNGFLTICAGVVLLQLSKSAKDVPDSAVFKGDLDQIQTIAEQEQPETEPKADAIRGTAAIVRRLSQARQKWELEELRRLQEEKRAEHLEPVGEDGPVYEWDGLRRRKTILVNRATARSPYRSSTLPPQFTEPSRTPHPPLGMSHFPSPEDEHEREREVIRTPSILSSIAGTIRNRTRSVATPSRSDFASDHKMRSPMHPVPLTEIAVHNQGPGQGGLYPRSQEHSYGLPSSQESEYHGARGMLTVPGSESAPELSPRRQFSFQNLFKRNHSHLHPADEEVAKQRPPSSSRGYSSQHTKLATEEERLGLVKGDSQSTVAFPPYEEEEDAYYDDEKARAAAIAASDSSRYGRGITTPPRRGSDGSEEDELAAYENRRRRYNENRSGSQSSASPPMPPPMPKERSRPPRGGDPGAFI